MIENKKFRKLMTIRVEMKRKIRTRIYLRILYMIKITIMKVQLKTQKLLLKSSLKTKTVKIHKFRGEV